MAKTREDWENDKNKTIDTIEDIKTFLPYNDILTKIFTYDDILNYTKDFISVGQFFMGTTQFPCCNDDYIVAQGRIEYQEQYDDYGRVKKNRYGEIIYKPVNIPYIKTRIDRFEKSGMELEKLIINILYHNLQDKDLRDFIYNISFRTTYLDNKFYIGRIPINMYELNADKFSKFENILCHHSEDKKDKDLNMYFCGSKYGTKTKRYKNNIEYYVNVKTLADYVRQAKQH